MIFGLPISWEMKSLKEINAVKKKTIIPNKFSDEIFEYYSIPAYQQAGVPEITNGGEINSSKLLLEQGTILFGKLNPRVEKVWKVEDHTQYRKIGSTEWLPILPGEGIDSDFLYYMQWSSYVMPIAKQQVSGSTPSRQRVDPSSFYKILIPIPPLPEQKRIALMLSLVQQAIKQQERLIDLTTELKKALMHKLFTEGARGEPQKQSEIGPIPESWDVHSIGDHCQSSAFGPRFSSKEYRVDGKIVTLRTTDMADDGSIDYSKAPCANLSYSKFQKHFLEINDIVVSRSGTCGIAGVFGGFSKPVLPGAFLIRLRMNRTITPEYLRQYINSRKGRERILGIAEGAIQKNISGTRLLSFKIPVPGIEEQKAITGYSELIDKKIFFHKSKYLAFQNLFRTLLHQLMTAQIRVNDLDLSELGVELNNTADDEP